jgi:hypothetical protein
VKYQQLCEDLKRTWKLKEIEVIPIIVGATGMVKRKLTECLKKIHPDLKMGQVQVEALRGTVTILKRALATQC